MSGVRTSESMKRQNFVPPANAFSHRFAVPASDIDELGHAGNVSWVRWVNEAAGAHSQSVGLGLAEYRELGSLWVVRRHDIEYLGAAFEGEELEALTWVGSLTGATTLRRTCFRRVKDGAELARAETTWVLVSASTGRPMRIPSELLARYGFSAA
jgi:acyl-CoA thioester hydrolase